MGKRPSYAWRSIIHGRELLVKGLTKMIGNGKSMSVWGDPWILEGAGRIPLMKNIFINLDLKVSDLLDISTGFWDGDMLDELFFPKDVLLILKRKPVTNQEDYWVWDHNKGGEYTVKSGHWLANNEKNALLIHEMSALPSINAMKEEIWAIRGPLKLKNFMWRAITGAIPVADQIRVRYVGKEGNK